MRTPTLTDSPLERVLAVVESTGARVKQQKPRDYLVSCPATSHGKGNGDRNPSLHLSEGSDEQVLVYCHAGCSTDEVLDALGLERSDLFLRKEAPEFPALRELKTKPKPTPPPAVACSLPECDALRSRADLGACVAQYPYTDEDGHLLGVVHRYEPGEGGRDKSFRPFTVTPDGSLRIGGTLSVPYELPRAREVLQRGGTVLVCEGEKDADRVNALGRRDLAGTTNSAGAGKWTDTHSGYLVGLGGSVQVVGDTDAAGQKHAHEVMESLQRVGVEAPVLSWPAEGKDLSEHLDAGLDIANLRKEAPEGPSYPRLGAVLSISDLDSLPPIRSSIDGYLSAPSAALLVGGYGLGKTALTLSMACSVASGTPFLGHEVEQRRTLYVVGEGARGMPRRVRAWSETWKRDLPEDHLSFMVRPRGSLSEPETWRDLLHYCRDEEIGFVVLDTMSALAPDADEVKDAPVITRGLNDLAEQMDGTALLVHHPGWSNSGRARGAYQLQGNVDEVLILTAATTDSDHLAVKVDKAKDGESGQTHYLRRIVVPLGHDENGDPVSSITVEHARLQDAEVPIRERILGYLAACGDLGASPSDIAKETGAERSSGGFRSALKHLETDGLLERRGNGRAVTYSLLSEE